MLEVTKIWWRLYLGSMFNAQRLSRRHRIQAEIPFSFSSVRRRGRAFKPTWRPGGARREIASDERFR
jgi:hypothetical protein